MPSGFQRSRATAARDGSSGLKGWDVIQEYMLSHDEDMIRDFADDIDTLLVFAGLFSAVLTAFIVGSVLALQQDNTQISAQILSVIALRLGAPAESQAFLNATALSLPTTPTFLASSSSVTINALWFTALVVSLAAALFGILVKQWCREYLRWHSVMTPAKDNVELRQLRFEAWQSWNVPSYIGVIPALLEIALVLFFVGLVIYVWTLQRTVAIFVSLVVAFCLVATVTLTALPAFARLCPFKTPTGFALALFVDFLQHSAPRIHVLPLHTSPAAGTSTTHGFETWGLRDRNAMADLCHASSKDHQDEHRTLLLSFRFSLLTRGLSWCLRSTDDAQVVVSVDESIRTFATAWDCSSALHALYRSVRLDKSPAELEDWLHSMLDIGWVGNTERKRFSFSPLSIGESSGDRSGPYPSNTIRSGSESAVSVRIGRKVLYRVFLQLVNDWAGLKDNDDSLPGEFFPPHPRLLAEVLCLLRYLPPKSSDREMYTADLRDWRSSLIAAFNQLGSSRDACLSGVPLMILHLLQWMGCPSIERKGTKMTVTISRRDHEPVKPGRYDENSFWFFDHTLATTLHAASLAYNWDCGRHLTVMAVSASLSALRSKVQQGDDEFDQWMLSHRELISIVTTAWIGIFRELVRTMIKISHLSLENSYRNCGALCDLPWIQDLVSLYHVFREPERDPILAGIFTYIGCEHYPESSVHSLLFILSANLQAGLISGEAARANFDQLVELVGAPKPPLDVLPPLVAPTIPASSIGGAAVQQSEPTGLEETAITKQDPGSPDGTATNQSYISESYPSSTSLSKARSTVAAPKSDIANPDERHVEDQSESAAQ